MTASGTFDITSTPEPPFDSTDGVLLGRMTFDKVFHGALQGTSVMHMTYSRTPVESSAGYVGVERIAGTLDDRPGSFILLHTGITVDGDTDLTLSIVPDSGTGQLAGITGTMTIEHDEAGHHYVLSYEVK